MGKNLFTIGLITVLYSLIAAICFAGIDFRKWQIEPGSVVFPGVKTGYAIQYKQNKANIVKTVDGGMTWTVCRWGKTIKVHDDTEPDAMGPESIQNLYFIDENTGYAYGGGQIDIPIFLITRDGGKSWSEMDYEKLYDIVGDAVEKIQMFNPLEGFIANLSGGLLKTFDGWETVIKVYPAKTEETGRSRDLRDYGWGLRDLFYFKDMNTGFIVAEKGVIYTADGGESWNLVLPFDGWAAEKISVDKSYIKLITKNKTYSTKNFGAVWH